MRCIVSCELVGLVLRVTLFSMSAELVVLMP